MRSRGNWKARPKLKSLRQENRDVHLKIVGVVNSPFVLTAAGDPARIFGPEVPKADTGSGAAWVCSGGLAPAPEGGASGSDDIAATAEAPGGTAASLGGATSGHVHIALDSGFRILITQFCCSLSRFLIPACLVSCSCSIEGRWLLQLGQKEADENSDAYESGVDSTQSRLQANIFRLDSTRFEKLKSRLFF